MSTKDVNQQIHKEETGAGPGGAELNGLGKVVRLLDRMVTPPSVVFHRIGGWTLAALMLLIAANVILRAAFDYSILGTVDVARYMLVIIACSGLPYVAVLKRHITADVLVSRLPRRPKRILYLVTDFISFALFVLVSWQSFVSMEAEHSLGSASSILYIPVYPFVAVVGVSSVLLTIVLLKDFLELLQGSR